MAHVNQLPCDEDGVCMRCKANPVEDELLTCFTCATSWHLVCLASPPESLASMLRWDCPDCTGENNDDEMFPSVGGDQFGGLVATIKEIESDVTLSEQDKAKKRQELLCGKPVEADDRKGKRKVVDLDDDEDALEILDESLNCSVCLQLLDRPVTAPCGHNFCLKCFQKWCAKGNQSCANCRQEIPKKMKMEPRINSALVTVIRMVKSSKLSSSGGPSRPSRVVYNEDKPKKAYTTKRAKRRGKAKASSGKILVTVPNGHFGPILPEHDPKRNQGVLVGEIWQDRFACRQWGVHFPLVGGVAGQNKVGAQSVVLSGGFPDDEDHGEWFLYSGSRGRNLQRNKRTSKKESFDPKFAQLNQALRVSCIEGYPIRVVRSHKEKRSCYAPDSKGLRYDGIYRIEMCWRKTGPQGFKIWRFLFVRCDNSPAPWTSDEHGDRPRPLPVIKELKKAFNIIKRKETPSWGFDEADGKWKWLKPPPVGKIKSKDTGKRKRKAVTKQPKSQAIRHRLLKEFSCLICQQVLYLPVTTTCGHNFCKTCLENAFPGQSLITERSTGGRTLRSIKNVMNCPFCSHDIADFLSNIQVNREVMDLIERLKEKTEKNEGGSAQQVGENEEEQNDDEVTEDEEGKNDDEVSDNEEAENDDDEVSENEEGENDEVSEDEEADTDDEVSENEEEENDEEVSGNEEAENYEEVSDNEEAEDTEEASSVGSDSSDED